MCGIVGFTGRDNAGYLDAMNRAQAHRGPDGEGAFSDTGRQVHLGMRRLAIIDLRGGRQPMSNVDGSIRIVFNGEIFNAPELRRDLAGQYPFKTDHSDTEVLLALYERDGNRMTEHLNGMFAFVIYDKRRGVLFGARDHFGIKPLHYCFENGKLSFSSEIKSLLALPWVSTEIDRQSLYDFLTVQTVPAPATIYASVRKIPAGSSFTFDIWKREFDVSAYWKPSFAPHPWNPEMIRSTFLEAVKRWTLSDVSIACSLSSGIDSPAVVGALASQSSQPIHTYTVGFRDAPEMDERALARMVSEKWGTKHHEMVITEDDLIGALPSMIDALDEPYAGGLPSWFVFKQMAQDVKVGLTGTGGDELFSNYGKWKYYESLGARLKKIIRFKSEGGAFSDLAASPHGSIHYPYFTDGLKRSDLLADCQNLRSTSSLIENIWRNCPSNNDRDRVAFVDLELQLPEEFLMMTDRFSMAHSLEARTPFLDRPFAEFVLGIPHQERITPEKPKNLFIDSIAELLPKELMTAKKKGFILPTGRWMRTRLRPIVESLLSPEYLKSQGIFQEAIFEKIARPHLESGADNDWRLWTLLCFQMWYERKS